VGSRRAPPGADHRGGGWGTPLRVPTDSPGGEKKKNGRGRPADDGHTAGMASSRPGKAARLWSPATREPSFFLFSRCERTRRPARRRPVSTHRGPASPGPAAPARARSKPAAPSASPSPRRKGREVVAQDLPVEAAAQLPPGPAAAAGLQITPCRRKPLQRDWATGRSQRDSRSARAGLLRTPPVAGLGGPDRGRSPPAGCGSACSPPGAGAASARPSSTASDC
jgi:hypothetical protein